MEQLVGSFAVVDSAGARSSAREYRKVVEFVMDGQPQTTLGSRRYELDTGSHLNPTEDGAFQDVATGKTWRRA